MTTVEFWQRGQHHVERASNATELEKVLTRCRREGSTVSKVTHERGTR